jgi:RNA polymerase sigma-70 factor, ECF subfamily
MNRDDKGIIHLASRLDKQAMIVQGTDTQADDLRIMEAAKADLSRFMPLYQRYVSRIYQYCLRRVESHESAEDLTSSIFTQVMTNIEGYKGGSVAAWLFRIAHNQVANHYRSRRPQVSFERTEIDMVDDEFIEPIDHLITAELGALLRLLIHKLPDEQQELLELKMTGGLTAEEIGIIVGKSAGAVRVELHRIITRLRAECERRGLA